MAVGTVQVSDLGGYEKDGKIFSSREKVSYFKFHLLN